MNFTGVFLFFEVSGLVTLKSSVTVGSGSDGFIDNELTVAYEIYNGSSTTEDVQTFLKYSYGVRGKQIEIDMSTSHTETVDVPSFWTKGLVRNTDTSTKCC